MSKVLEVAVGVIVRSPDLVLISQRRPFSRHPDLWEFPGGKRHPNESRVSALKRELKEELGIRPTVLQPFMRHTHAYADFTVALDVWLVGDFMGKARGVEGQVVRWVKFKTLEKYHFLAANWPIIQRMQQELASTVVV